MPESTRLVRDDAYVAMGSSYQRLQVTILDAALRENGVTDPTARQKICASFLFAMGDLHDQGWLKTTADSEPIYPLLCFTKRFLNTDTPIDQLGDVFAPSMYCAFHEYAHGNAALLYEGDPDAHVETGNFEGEERTNYEFGSEPRESDKTYEKFGNLVTSGACVQCGGSGQCFCIRKGPGNPIGCVRCNGSGQCGVCQGSGKARR